MYALAIPTTALVSSDRMIRQTDTVIPIVWFIIRW